MLSLFLLAGCAVPVVAAEADTAEIERVEIHNLKNLEKLARNCRLDSYSRNLVVSLQADLDLEGKSFEGVPIFCGRFEGNGHTIRGVNLTQEGSVQGFFRYLTETAVVNDLHLEGIVQPAGTGNAAGGFVGKNSGTIYGCSFTGTVSGKEYIGGIAGENTVTGTIENCHARGMVYGDHFVGGITGKNAGTIRSCENHAAINETSRKNQVELSDITRDTLLHSEAANTVTDVGGIAGNSTGVIRDCINHASVGYQSMGYNIGGIAGTQSGSILSCENRGQIRGRKEVGGIVGQMEPSAVMKFEEDVLQILSRQLDGLGKAVSKATSNLQGAGDAILGRMDDMYEYVWDARDAVDSLIPDAENPNIPDMDALQAAKNSIGSSLSGMSHVMEGVSATAYNAIGKVSANLHDINDQINAMRRTIGNISETTGGSIIDRSDEDTELDLSGKVAESSNAGEIHGDLNCGGIAGAISLENDLDMEEDWRISGENSLNFESELRAVILNCTNSGKIVARKQNTGGIVGLQSLGLVKMSRNSGEVEAASADYVGGISGRSMGFIRNSHAKCDLSGSNYVGGIAGAAAVATDCCTQVRICSGIEKIGSVLGDTEENKAEVEKPISGNYYLAVQEDPGAIDGISYADLAQPMQEEEFFQLENLPELFRHVTVTFLYDNGTERKFTVNFGDPFPEKWIPPIQPKDGKRSYWKELETTDLSEIFFDLVFEQAYVTQTTVLESTFTRNGVPLLFVQGAFAENTAVDTQQSEDLPAVEKDERLLEAWQFRTPEPAAQTQIRFQLPEEVDAEEIRILIRGADSTWREEAFHVLGRYAVAALASGDDAIGVVQTADSSGLFVLLFAGLAILGGILLCRKRRKE